MRPLLLIAALFLYMPAAQSQTSQDFRPPSNGNDLLEVCGHLVDALDSPASQTGSSMQYVHNMFKQGLCAGHLQAMRAMIVFWQVQVAKAIAVSTGEANPSADEIEQVVAKSADMTCIPSQVTMPQMARILVKWLRDHPERLHEPASLLTVDAFHDAFPCVANPTK